MKNLQNKYILAIFLICSSLFVFAQDGSPGRQIKATMRTNGTRGQLDVYLTSDFSSTSADAIGNITLAFGVPVADTTVNTKVKIINSQITGMPISAFAAAPTRIVGNLKIFPFSGNYAGSSVTAFVAGTEFKICTFEVNDSTMKLSNISLVDNQGGNPGNFIQYYLEIAGLEVNPLVRADKFYPGTGGTLGNSTNGFGTMYFVKASTQVVLPINLLSFTATKAGTGVSLNWKMSSEINAKGYEVERSTGNGAAFSVIGNVQATAASNYSITDARPLSGVNYYRLKLVDNDGNYTYSAVRKLLFNGKAVLFNLYPNPVVNNTLNLQLQQYNYDGKAQAVITDIAGRNVQTTLINLIKGSNQFPIVFKNLDGGTYFIAINTVEGAVIAEPLKWVKL